MYKQTIFSTFLKEPLLHFLLIGTGLFFLFSHLNDDINNTNQIIISKSKTEILFSTFQEENGRAATYKEMQKILEDDIREEVLYREAIAIGLDKDDKVIRHRLAQKMKYLFEDVSMTEEPSEEVLKAFFQKNQKEDQKNLEYSNLKQQLKAEWIEEEKKKENEVFYNNLKSRYKIIIDEKIGKELNVSNL